MIRLESEWSLALAITIILFSSPHSGVEANYEAPLKYRQYALNATDLPCGSEVEVKQGGYYLFDSASAIMYESSLYAQASANYDSSRKKREVLVDLTSSSGTSSNSQPIAVKILSSARAYGGGGNRGTGHPSSGGGGEYKHKYGSSGGGGAGYGNGGKYGGGGGGGYGQPIQPAKCQWTFFAGEDCSLEMHIIRFRPGDMNCYKQQFIVSDNHTEFKLCGYKKLYPGFRAETPILNIQYWKQPYTYRHVFKGYVTCTGRAQNPTYDESHQFYTPADIPGEVENGQVKSHQAHASSHQTDETSSQSATEARALEEAPASAAVENSLPQSQVIQDSQPQSHVESSHPQSHIVETKIVTVTKTETFFDDTKTEQQTHNVAAEAQPQKEVKGQKKIRGGGLSLDQKMANAERQTHSHAQEEVGQVAGRDAEVHALDNLEPESNSQAVIEEKVTKTESVVVLVDEEFDEVDLKGANVEEEKTTEKEVVILVDQEETDESQSVEPQKEQLAGRNSYSNSISTPSNSQYAPPPMDPLTTYPPPNYPFLLQFPAPAYGYPYPNVMYRPAPQPVNPYPNSYDFPLIDSPVNQPSPYASISYPPPPPVSYPEGPVEYPYGISMPPSPPPAYQPPPPPYGQGPPVEYQPGPQQSISPSPPYFPQSQPQPAPSYAPPPTYQYTQPPPPPPSPPMSPSFTFYRLVESPSYLYAVPVSEGPLPIYPNQPGPPEETYARPPSYQPYFSPPPPPPVEYYQEMSPSPVPAYPQQQPQPQPYQLQLPDYQDPSPNSTYPQQQQQPQPQPYQLQNPEYQDPSPVPAYPQQQPQPQPYQLQLPEYQDPSPVSAYPQPPQPQPQSYPVQSQVPPSYPSVGYDYLFASAADPSLSYVVTCELPYPQPCQPLNISPISVQPPQQPPPPPSYQAPPQTPIYGRQALSLFENSFIV